MDAIAIFDFHSRNPSETSFKKGDTLKVWPYDDFWVKSKKGLVPLNRIEINNKKFSSFDEISAFFELRYTKVYRVFSAQFFL